MQEALSHYCFFRLVIEKQRPPPRLPDFLDDSLRREGIFDDYLSTDIQSTSGQSPRRVQSYEISMLERNGEPASCSNSNQDATPSTSRVLPVPSVSENFPFKLKTLSSPPAENCKSNIDSRFCVNETLSIPNVSTSNRGPTANLTGVVLLPPSAFLLPPEKPPPPSPNLSLKSCEAEESDSSTIEAESTWSDQSFDEKKDTF